MSFDEMYAQDGIYAIWGFAMHFYVEVADGVCHQLTPKGDFPRDGELSREGWAGSFSIEALPFVRK